MKFTYVGDASAIFPTIIASDGSTLEVDPGDVVDIDPELAEGVPTLVPVEKKKSPATPAE